MVDHKLYGSRAEFEGTIDRVLVEFGVELVCLAGFMRILTGTFVKKWTGMTTLFSPYSLMMSWASLNLFLFNWHRKATEHPSIPAARVQGCECPEAGSAGWGASGWMHSPLRRSKYDTMQTC